MKRFFSLLCSLMLAIGLLYAGPASVTAKADETSIYLKTEKNSFGGVTILPANRYDDGSFSVDYFNSDNLC